MSKNSSGSKNGSTNGHNPDLDIRASITFRNTEATEALKAYAEEKLGSCVRKFAHHETELHIVLTVEKNRHIAEISFHLDGSDFKGSEESNDLYASVDKLVDSLGHQLRKHKERITAHH